MTEGIKKPPHKKSAARLTKRTETYLLLYLRLKGPKRGDVKSKSRLAVLLRKTIPKLMKWIFFTLLAVLGIAFAGGIISAIIEKSTAI